MDISTKPTSEKTSLSRQATTKSAESGARAPHKIELDHLHSMFVTGVVDVPTFTDKTVTVRLSNETLTIYGQNLAIKSLDVDNGKLQLSGQVNSLKYSAQSSPTSFAKRIFK